MRRTSGVALLMTMAAVAVAFVIGMTVLAGLPSASRASANLIDRQTAMYLAESGLQEGIARMYQPPPGQSIWTGATGRSVSGLSGTYDVTITDLGSSQYRIDSVGHARRSTGGGAVSISQALHLTVSIKTTSTTYQMPAATVIGGGSGFTFLTTSVTYNGDVAVYGSVINLARVNGNLTASGSIINLGNVSGSVDSNTSVDSPPNLNIDSFTQYSYNGRTYQAQVIQPQNVRYMSQSISPVTSSNPLGVVVVAGDMTLTNNLSIQNGILVVRGDFNPGSHSVNIQGQRNYFGLMVGGDMYYSNYTNLNVSNAPAYIKGTFAAYGYAGNAWLNFNAGLVTLQPPPTSLNCSIQVNSPPGMNSKTNNGNGWGANKKSATEPVAINLLVGGSGGSSGGSSPGAAGCTVQMLSYSASTQP